MRKYIDYAVLALKGMGMGASDIIPGVSGGTIAFITGIYEELVYSIKSINLPAVKLIFSLRFKDFWKYINGNFLLIVFSGILTSVFSLSRLIEYLLIHYPVYIWSFFFGLITASSVYILRVYLKRKWQHFLTLIAGIILAYLITSVSPAETSSAYWFIFLSGAVAICAMILPGISGSFILLLMGKYQYILNAVNEYFTRNFSQLSKKGEVFLDLENKQEPFSGGLNILIKVARGKYFDITSLSGGEKTLVALSLIFAIQEYKPYCFYIFDEIDAALDKRNSELLTALIKKYMTSGQYIIITHNDALISETTTLYGVSMQENISKVISLKI